MPNRIGIILLSGFLMILFGAEASAAERKLRDRIHRIGILNDGKGQYLEVFDGSRWLRSFWVSTGNPKKIVHPYHRKWDRIQGQETPAGTFSVSFIKPRHTSSQSADQKSLPYSVFFNKSIAIHATDNPAAMNSSRRNF